MAKTTTESKPARRRGKRIGWFRWILFVCVPLFIISLVVYLIAWPGYSRRAWPTGRFPNVPVYTGKILNVSIENRRAVVDMPNMLAAEAGEEVGFTVMDYKALLHAGSEGFADAVTICEQPGFSAFVVGGMDVQIFENVGAPRIILCDEPELEHWPSDEKSPVFSSNMKDFPKPQNGRAVSAQALPAPWEGDDGCIVLVRGALPAQAWAYCDQLQLAGYVLEERRADVTTDAFYTRYRKANMTITVDYYQNSTDYSITFVVESVSKG